MTIFTGIAISLSMTLGTLITVGQVVAGFATLAAISYQAYTASKMRKAARAAAEARKGFELVIDGGIQTVPLVYGRALVGGTRVFHNTSSRFEYVPNNANRTFNLGALAVPSRVEETLNQDTLTVTSSTTIPARPAGTLNQTVSGTKNEFLFFQQTLCLGPINSVYDVVIDDSQFLDDPSLGESETTYVFKSGAFIEDNDQKAALRLDYFYNGGNDALMSKNFGNRSLASFPEIAYMSAYIRLDRDQPQFSKVPAIQTFIEGRTVRKITKTGTAPSYTYLLNQAREYTNNPAYCLLDYLLDTQVGKGLSIDQIDLESFYESAEICNRDAQESPVYVGGKIWQPTTPTRIAPILQRNIPLYECNIILDTSKPVRENVEKILTTMGDARLVWSQGKYKLLLQYPTSNSQIIVAATLTDDDIAHDKPVEISWPGNGNRFNNATVKFSNESQNFKEDSVSWPPKENRQDKRGVGVKKYLPVSGWDSVKEGGVFLNNYGVWQGNTSNASMQWKIIANETGIYTLKFTADNSISITINGITYNHNKYETVKEVNTVSLIANTEYTISITASDDGISERGAAAQLIAPSGVTSWTTRDDSYTAFINFAVTDTLYQQFLNEDNNIKLETEVFADGVTDYYHALAKAEEIVRVSRTAAIIKFEYIVRDKYLEPGDIIKINSETLKLGNTSDLYLKVDEVKLQEGAICEVTGTRFDYTQLAWNSKDSEFIKLPNIYSAYITAPYYLNFIPGTALNETINNPIPNSPGILEWGLSPDPDVTEYILYFHKAGDTDVDGYEVFTEIGRALLPPFNIPYLESIEGIFGVKAVTTRGTSGMTVNSIATTVTKIDTKLIPLAINNLSAIIYGTQNESVKLQWNLPLTTIDPTISYIDHDYAKIFRAKLIAPTTQNPNPILTFTEIGVSNTEEFIDTPTDYGILVYKIKLVSKRRLESQFSNAIQITVDYWQRFSDPSVPVTGPTSLVADANYSSIELFWANPIHNIGGGHESTNIYMALWPNNTIQPLITNAKLIANVTNNTNYYFFTAEPSTRYVFWIKEVTKGGGVSNAFSGPAIAITSEDIQNLLRSVTNSITEEHLFTTLNTRIDLIDDPTTGLVKKTNDLEVVFGTTQTAAQYASDASNSASNAVTSANTAAAKALDSANSAVNAASAELSAAGYSLSSSNNASNAFNYANNASNSASNAAGSASQASTSAATAASSANSASNSASNALVYSNNSANSASNAAGSASSASTSSILATNAKNDATNSASNALIYSNNSANSASNALSSASSASTSATLATNAKNDATNSAANALIYSNNSANSASNAAQSSSDASNTYTLTVNAKNDAANSAASALISKNDSANSASNALGSASSASTSATLATNAKNDASNSAANSLIYSNNSANSASNAAQSSSDASNTYTLTVNAKNDAANSAASALISKNDSANSASNALGSASSASASAILATNAKNDASNSASNALIYSNNSANSASNASGSASSASTSATLATNAKNDASNSAANALIYSNNSANSASNAAQSSSDASNTYTLAVNAKNDASNSAANALIYSNQAANSASNAAISESNANISQSLATNAKNDASNSAASALSYKNDSANSAADASGYANSAATSLAGVQAIANNTNSAVQQKMTARAAADGSALAEYSVVVDINGKIAGFGLGSTLANNVSSSVFGVRADKFFIAGTGNAAANEILPFSVLTTPDAAGNPVGVYINDAYIKAKSLTVSKLASSESELESQGRYFRLGGTSYNPLTSALIQGKTTTYNSQIVQQCAIGGAGQSTQYPAVAGVALNLNAFGLGGYCFEGSSKKSQLVSGHGAYAAIATYLNYVTQDTITNIVLATPSYAANAGQNQGKIYAFDGYTPFTGIHDGIINKTAQPKPGDIIVDLDVLAKLDISNIIAEYSKSNYANQPGVIGVCNKLFEEPPEDWKPDSGERNNVTQSIPLKTDYYEIPETHQVIHVNGLGEGLINVCNENGNINKGDLIVTSSIPGKGMKQSDNIVKNITVAKARESVTFNSSNEIKQIACIYMCG